MKGYYHNVSKGKVNIWIPDVEDLSDIAYEIGDIIYRTDSGDATLHPVFLKDLMYLLEKDTTEEGEC